VGNEQELEQTTLTARWDEAGSSIELLETETDVTGTTTQQGTRTVLTTTSAGTFLLYYTGGYAPLDIFSAVPTVYAWSGAPGWTVPDDSEGSGADISFSGQTTIYPQSDIIEIDLRLSGDEVTITETWQSLPATWTAQTVSGTQTTVASNSFFGRFTTQTVSAAIAVASTRTSSGIFQKTNTYREITSYAFSPPPKITETVSEWWASTELRETTFAVLDTTTGGSTTTTVLASSERKKNPFRLGLDVMGMVPLDPISAYPRGKITMPIAGLGIEGLTSHRLLTRGQWVAFRTHNAGWAIDPSTPGAALSHDGQSFPLPPATFSTALSQANVTIPRPFQTRSSKSGSSTTLWSLDFSEVSITTISTNTSETNSTTSAYSMKTVAPTLFFTNSVSATAASAFVAAGGSYPTQSFVAAGGLVSATDGSNEYTTSGAISVGSGVTAFNPLPFFAAKTGAGAAVATSAAYAQTQAGQGPLRVLAAPLTA
jgi:hypothetical protein